MIEVYRFRGDVDDYELVARFNNDASVDGDTLFADRLRNKLAAFPTDYPPEDYTHAIEAVIEQKYNSGAFLTNRQ